jgi:hypothetical protein
MSISAGRWLVRTGTGPRSPLPPIFRYNKGAVIEAPEALSLGLLNEGCPTFRAASRADENRGLLQACADHDETGQGGGLRLRRTCRGGGPGLDLRAIMSEDFREGLDAFSQAHAELAGQKVEHPGGPALPLAMGLGFPSPAPTRSRVRSLCGRGAPGSVDPSNDNRIKNRRATMSRSP